MAGTPPTPVKLVTAPDLHNQDVVAWLEGALAKARAGEYTAAVGAMVCRTGGIVVFERGQANRLMVMGALADLQHMLGRKGDGNESVRSFDDPEPA